MKTEMSRAIFRVFNKGDEMNSKTKEVVTTAMFFLSTLSAIYFLWDHEMVLTFVAMAIGAGKLYIERGGFLIYVTMAILGPIAEVVIVHAGAWQYGSPDWAGIPMWLPFLWGSAALSIQRLCRHVDGFHRTTP